jgi:hypothetical protein
MDRRIVLAALLLAVLFTTVVAVTLNQPSDPLGVLSHERAASPAPLTPAQRIARGEYLVKNGACMDCHVPWKMHEDGPGPDLSRGLSGHPEGFVLKAPPPQPEMPWVMTVAATNTAWAGPWGVSFTANLTPDKETGIGSWTAENFRSAIRTGRHMGRGRPILPPMPWPMYRNATDDDLASVFAFLRTIKPVSNHVPDPTSPAGPASTN